MKNYLLYLITTLIVFSSCQKEDDILQPIQQPTTNTTSVDTLTTQVDTINISTFGPDSCLVPSSDFVCLGKRYNIIHSKFSFESYDTTYGFEHYNEGTVSFHMDGEDTLTTRVYPRNGHTSQTHSMNMSSPISKFGVTSISYTPAIVVVGLTYTNCIGITVNWDVTMQVLEYINGDVGLKIINTGYSGPHPILE